MQLWLSHPTGNANVRGLLQELERRQADYHFFTTLGVSRRWEALVSRRGYTVPPKRFHPSPWLEIARLSRWGPTVFDVYQGLDRRVARRIEDQPPNVIYAYEDGALAQFRAATGVLKVYDLPIAYWKTAHRWLKEEAERWPEWKATLGTTRDSQEKLDRKTEELALADVVVCPSRFVQESLPTGIRARSILSPFGSPPLQARPRSRHNQKLRILFAGSMTQRKGLADLFGAMRLVQSREVELIVAGATVRRLEFYRKEFPDFVYEPPRAHSAMLELMCACDVLVLPSLVEGRALVQQEALACGLPIVVTANAGGEDLIEEGKTGFLVPTRSPQSIAERIDWFARHRNDLERMRAECQRKAAEYSWGAYASRILDAVDNIRTANPQVVEPALEA